MPDFAKSQGSFSAGKIATDVLFYFVVLEEWSDGVVRIILGAYLFFG